MSSTERYYIHRNVRILYLESIVKEITTMETGKSSFRLPTCIFYRYIKSYQPIQATSISICVCYQSTFVAQHHSKIYELLVVNCVARIEKFVNVCDCQKQQKLTLIRITFSKMLRFVKCSSNLNIVFDNYRNMLPIEIFNLWSKYKGDMIDVILHQIRTRRSNPDLQLKEEIHNKALILIEGICLIDRGY